MVIELKSKNIDMYITKASWYEVDSWKAYRSLEGMSKDFMFNDIRKEVDYKK